MERSTDVRRYLNHLPSPNPAQAAQFVSRYGLTLNPHKPRPTDRRFLTYENQEDLDALASRWRRVPVDSVVGERLRRAEPSPLELWCTGDLPSPPYLTVVGPRQPSDYAVTQTRRLVAALAPQCTVVSGLARGVDTEALEAALTVGGRVIAIVPQGLNEVAARPSALVRRIMAQGAVLAERLIVRQLTPAYFLFRNRLLAQLADVVWLPEAALKSGTAVTARLAMESNITLATLPGDLTRSNAAGSNRLLAQGAQLVLEPADLAALLGLHLPSAKALTGLPAILSAGPQSLEKIMEQTGWSTAEALRQLSTAQAAGILSQDWHGRWQLLARGPRSW